MLHFLVAIYLLIYDRTTDNTSVQRHRRLPQASKQVLLSWSTAHNCGPSNPPID